MKNLPLIQNGEYFLTTNILTNYGYVNSAKVILKQICTEDNNLYSINDYNNNNITSQPKFILVKLLNNSTNKSIIFENLQNDLFYLEPITKSFNVLTSKHSTKTISIKRTQYPLSPSFAMTSHKLQGKTVEKLIVDLSKPPTGHLDFAYAYVALSRVKTINDLLILRPFDKSILNVKIPIDLEEEMERMKLLQEKTLKQ